MNRDSETGGTDPAHPDGGPHDARRASGAYGAYGTVLLTDQAQWVDVKHPVYPLLLRRMAAAMVDVCLLVALLPSAWTISRPRSPDSSGIELLLAVSLFPSFLQCALIMGLVACVYMCSMQCGSMGQTVGERLCRIRVRTLKGQAPTLAQAATRFFGAVLNIAVLAIPWFGCLKSPRRQAWYERLTHTVTVDERATHGHIRAFGCRPNGIDGLSQCVLVLSMFAIGSWSMTRLEHLPERMAMQQVFAALEAPLVAMEQARYMSTEFPPAMGLFTDVMGTVDSNFTELSPDLVARQVMAPRNPAAEGFVAPVGSDGLTVSDPSPPVQAVVEPLDHDADGAQKLAAMADAKTVLRTATERVLLRNIEGVDLGPLAKVRYLGEGRIEVKFDRNSDIWRGASIVIEAAKPGSSERICTATGFSEHVAPNWCALS